MIRTEKETAASRRDMRNAKDAIRPTSVGRRGKKRWCKGKPGVEHAPRCMNYDEVKGIRSDEKIRARHPGWKLLVCATCGKELDFFFPLGVQKRNPPGWVT